MKTHQYLDCGLDYIRLKNGYHIYSDGDEEMVAVDDIIGLHRTIAQYIVRNKATLASQDFRFLRKEMNLSQVRLAQLLGVSESSIRDYEKSRRKKMIPGSVDRLMRAFFINEDIRELIVRISDIDTEVETKCFVLQETEMGWKAA